jgi:hypothetical protein
MDNMNNPQIAITKRQIPVLYLDTCALIELAKYEKGCCTDAHSNLIGELYNKVSLMMQTRKIMCPLGNQFEEMGAVAHRRDARYFLYRFLNSAMQSPSHVLEFQLTKGYRAFANNCMDIQFNSCDFFEHDTDFMDVSASGRSSTIYSGDELRQIREEKHKLVTTLNDMKNSGQNAKNYHDQLERELQAELQVLQYTLQHSFDSLPSFIESLDTLYVICQRVGFNMYTASLDDVIKAIRNYKDFLLSPYHQKMPYIWVGSVLFSHIMQRANKVKQGDNLDIKWASAYLPFVDYAVTDNNFCDLLNQSGLSEQYGTKVFCFKTLDELLKNL